MERTMLIMAGIAIACIAYAFYELARAGLFHKIAVKTVVLGPYLVLYKNVVGAYNCPPQNSTAKEVCRLVVDAGLVHKNDADKIALLGVYFDNPQTVPAKELRASIGYVFKSGAQILTPEEVAKQKEWLSQCSVIKTGELKVGFIPASRCVACSYPYTTMLSLILAVIRIYPGLLKAFEKASKACKPGDEPKTMSSLEVYMRAEKRMWISFPLTNRAEMLPFDLPETVGTEEKKKL